MIIKRFREQVKKFATKSAVKTANQSITYGELDIYTNGVANAIMEMTAANDSSEAGASNPQNRAAALLFEHGVHMIIGVIGTLKADNIYVPLDITYPEKRLAYMLEHSGSTLILTNDKSLPLAEQLAKQSQQEIGILNIEHISDQHLAVDIKKIKRDDSEDQLAYILYTSGSTGLPKGVMQTHRNVLYYIRNWVQRFSITESDRMTLFSAFSHDGSVQDMFAALLSGVTLYPYNIKTSAKIDELYNLLMKKKITIWHSVPSLYRYFANSLTIKDCFYDIRWVLLGGEPLRAHDLELFNIHFPKATLANVYGQTESSVTSICTIFPGDSFEDVTLGEPLDETEILLVDKDGGVVEEMGIGEIVVSSPYIAPGYWKDKENTEEVFTHDDELGTLYWTGDQGLLEAGGSIKMMGRKDLQIKIRGFRVELGEIETALLQHDALKEVAASVRVDEHEENYICAYYVSEEKLSANQLREYIGTKLPDYMIPRYFIPLETMPLTPNGKIQRNALPDPQEISEPGLTYEAPGNEVEEKLVAIWQEVLEIDRVGISDHFVELGGHSLLIMSILGRIQQEFNVELQFNDVFENPTVKELARLVMEIKSSLLSPGMQERQVQYPSRFQDLANLHQPFPLTHIQSAFLLGREEQFDIGGISTHIYMELDTNMDIHRLNKSLNQLIVRHPMMRAIIMEDGTQQILEQIPTYEISVEDITHLDPAQQRQRIEVEGRRISNRIFNLSEWPLFEIKGMRLSQENLYLLLSFDLIIADGHSLQIIVDDLMAFYQDPGLAAEPLQFTFRDYILAANELRNSDIYAADKKYWLDQLESFPPAPRLPMVCKPSEVDKPSFRVISKVFLREEWEILQRIAQENNITPSALLCAAYARVLAYWSNQEELAINLTLFNRYPFHEDVNKIVGNFTSLILLAVEWDPELSFLETAVKLHKKLMEALDHRHFDGVEFIREISRYKHSITQALMPVVFTSMMVEEEEGDADELDYRMEIRKRAVQTSQVFLEFQAILEKNRLVVVWDFVENLFDRLVIETMFEQYIGIIKGLIEGEPEYRFQLPGRDRLLWETYNNTRGDIPPSLLHQLFKRQVVLTPDNIALEYQDRCLTYRQLDEKSNQVAAYLREQGVEPNQLVAILTTRSLETIVNVMGILKAGGAYVPIEPDFPQERRNYIYTNSNCRLLAEPELYVKENLVSYPAGTLENINSPQDRAYVIFTSGSTGRPKGVMVTHQQAANTIIDINRRFKVNEKDRVLGISSMCFDLSVYDVFGTLSTGARLVLIPTQKDVDILIDALDTGEITFWNSVPAILDMVVNHLEADYVNFHLTRALLSGDWIPLTLPDNTRKHFPHCEVSSLGGATEGSIWSIYYPIKKVKKEWKSIPYGYPLTNQAFYVLNHQQQLCPVDVPGELYIGGMGVVEGYINDEEKTNHAFLNHTIFGRIYRTGDYGVFHRGGYIEFLGRKDQQVKIRGYRIELGEIENCLLEHENIQSAIVIDGTTVAGSKILCAYVVLETGITNNVEGLAAELKGFLSQALPDYMIPSFFIQLVCIPLTPNGKVDRKSLPDPQGETDREVKFQAPGNEIEETFAQLWQEILEVGPVGVNNNFFELGGDSLKAAIMLSKVQKALNIKLPLAQIFATPTIRELAQYVNKAPENRYISIEPIEKKEYYVLSSAQKRLYILQQMELNSTAYNISGAIVIPGELDLLKLENVFKELINRHESFRTSFHMIEGEPIQRVHEPHEVEFKIECYGRESATGNNLSHPFDLSQAPLLRVGLIKTQENNHFLMTNMHHIISDGTSLEILVEEFEAIYDGKQLPALRLQYKDYSQWQKHQKGRTTIKSQEDYWLQEYEGGVPILSLPLDYPRPSVPHFEGNLLKFEIDIHETRQLYNIAREQGTTMFVVLLAIYSALLSKLTGQEDIVIGTPIEGRSHADLENIIGMFVNMLAIKNKPGRKKSFDAYLQEVKTVTLKAFENQDYQFEDLVDQLKLNREPGRNPLFDIAFVYARRIAGSPQGKKSESKKSKPFEYENYDNRTAKFDLIMNVTDTGTRVLAFFNYKKALFKRETIERMVSYFKKLVTQVIKNPGKTLIELEIISKEEMKTLIQQEKKKYLNQDGEINDDGTKTMDVTFNF